MPNQIQNRLFDHAPCGSSDKRYFLTSSRHLTRILDQGLIGEGLVMTDSSSFPILLAENELAIDNCRPKVPVILEVQSDVTPKKKFYSISVINQIHFPEKESLDDFFSRRFENVPIELFKWKATPSLFSSSSANKDRALRPLEKPNREFLFSIYRQPDAVSGALYWIASNSTSSSILTDLLKDLTRCRSIQEIQEVIIGNIIKHFSDSNICDDATMALRIYLDFIIKYNIEEGWPRNAVLKNFENLLVQKRPTSKILKSWLNVSQLIISSQRDMVELTDENQIYLRAILLHLLNPKHDALDRITNSNLEIGTNVQKIAHLLASSLTGIATIPSPSKQQLSGLFIFISDLVSSSLNGDSLSLDRLESTITDKKVNIRWMKLPLSTVIDDNEKISETIQLKDKHQKPDINTRENDIPNLESISEKIANSELVLKSSAHDKEVNFTLKKTSKAKLSKSVRFTAEIFNERCVFSCRILNMSIANQARKLTGKKALASLQFQSENTHDFRFELINKKSFSAVIRLKKGIPDDNTIHETIVELLTSLNWFNEN